MLYLNDEVRAKLLWERGRAHWTRRDFRAAIESLREVTRLRPHHGEAWQLLARCYWELGEFALAHAAYEQVLTHLPDFDTDALIETLQALGELEIKLRRYRDAEQRFQHILAQQPRNPAALYALAALYYRIGLLRRGCKAAEAAYKAAPNLMTARLLADLYRDWGNFAAAREWYQQAEQFAREWGDRERAREFGRAARACEFGGRSLWSFKDQFYVRAGTMLVGTQQDDGLSIRPVHSLTESDVQLTLQRCFSLWEAYGWDFTVVVPAEPLSRPLAHWWGERLGVPLRSPAEVTLDDFVLLTWAFWEGGPVLPDQSLGRRVRRLLIFALTVGPSQWREGTDLPDLCGVLAGATALPWRLAEALPPYRPRFERRGVTGWEEELHSAEEIAARWEDTEPVEWGDRAAQIAYYQRKHRALRESLRPGRRTVVRIGLLPEREVAPLLAALPQAVERGFAPVALRRLRALGVPEGTLRETLREVYRTTTSPAVRRKTVLCLAHEFHDWDFLEAVYQQAAEAEEQAWLAVCLASRGRVADWPRWKTALQEADEMVRCWLGRALPGAYLGLEENPRQFLQTLLADVPAVAAVAVRLLAAWLGEEAEPELRRLAQDERREVAQAAQAQLRALRFTVAAEKNLVSLELGLRLEGEEQQSAPPAHLRHILRHLSQQAPAEAITLARRLTRREDYREQFEGECLPLFEVWGGAEDMPYLVAALDHELRRCRAAQALRQKGWGTYFDVLLDALACANRDHNRTAMRTLAGLPQEDEIPPARTVEGVEILLRTLGGAPAGGDAALILTLGQIVDTPELHAALARIGAKHPHTLSRIANKIVAYLRESNRRPVTPRLRRQTQYGLRLLACLSREQMLAVSRYLAQQGLPAQKLGLLDFLRRNEVAYKRKLLTALAEDQNVTVRWEAQKIRELLEG
ncbi:MAG TPA: tetratricopeptide repeat protein [Armatimonadetes bacterium]|nr:tetratricopeptide repeat protein [Armatimonadota bacterium]